MLFSSFSFLLLFLPFVLGGYYILPKEDRNFFLLVSSIVFYGWDKPRLIFLLLGVILVNYIGAIVVQKLSKLKKLALAAFIVSDIACLSYFKYTNFMIDSLNAIIQTNYTIDKIVLPLGISFYIFQAISYLVDTYKGQCRVQKNPINFMLYISFFPQLIAGPIIKYHEIADQIENRKETFASFYYGIRRFIIGLAKKVLIANALGTTVDQVFTLPLNELDVGVAWLGVVFYALQIYYDFSGYADMAIGLGAMFGFTIPENFNYPLLSTSLSEYWRRWHISLGTWVKWYLYIPLGGSRCSNIRHYFNLFITFFVIGIWHGASLNMILFGFFNGLIVILESILGFSKTVATGVKKIFLHFYFLTILMLITLIGKAENLSYTWDYFLTLIGLNQTNEYSYSPATFLTNYQILIAGLAVIGSFPILKNILHRQNRWFNLGVNGFLFVLYILSVASLLTGSYNPFIYFRF